VSPVNEPVKSWSGLWEDKSLHWETVKSLLEQVHRNCSSVCTGLIVARLDLLLEVEAKFLL